MKKILFLAFIAFGLPLSANAAIAHDGAVVTHSGSTSFSITINTGDVVAVGVVSSGSAPTACTIAGSSMTAIGSQADGGGSFINTFYHLTPTVGSDTVSCSGGTIALQSAQAYSGADQTTIDGSNGGNTATTPLTVAVTTANTGDWVVGYFVAEHATLNSSTLTSLDYNGTTNGGEGLFDSNGTVGTGSNNYSWTMSANTNMAAVLLAFTPAATVTTPGTTICLMGICFSI